MTQSIPDLAVNPSAETIHIGPLTVRFLLTRENSNGSVAAFELGVPSAQRLTGPPHSHDAYEETIYCIRGVLRFTVDGKEILIAPGQALCIPRGAVHSFDNPASEDALALCVITPAVLGPEYFREVRAVFEAAAGGPPDHVKIAEIMRRHGLTPVA